MSVIKCPQCNLVNFAGAIICKRCNFTFEGNLTENNRVTPTVSKPLFEPQQRVVTPTPPAVYQPSPYQSNYQNPYQSSYQSTNYSYNQNQSQSKKLAIFSMILGIMSFPVINIILASILSIILAVGFGAAGAVIGLVIPLSFLPTGLITGITALIRANKRPAEFGGKGFAIVGIVLSGLSILIIPIVAAIAVPNLLAARRSANEASAISSLRTLDGAEQTYYATAGQGHYGELAELGNSRLIDNVLASGTKNGYVFTVNKTATGYEAWAKPLNPKGINSTGSRSFYYSSEDKILRAADKKGLPADRSDRPLDSGMSDSPPKISQR